MLPPLKLTTQNVGENMTIKPVNNGVGAEGFMSIIEACEMLNVSRTTLYFRMKTKTIRGKKDGRMTKVCRRSVRDYIENLPDYTEVH